MAAVVIALYGRVAPMGNLVATVITIAAAGVVYAAVLLMVGGISENDIKMLPKSDKILPLMKKMKFIR